MRKFVPLALALLLMSAIAPPAWARIVAIEAAVPLADSEEALRSAVKKAIENAVRGAAALGLGSLRVNDAKVSSNALMLRLIATDDNPDDTDPDDLEAGARA